MGTFRRINKKFLTFEKPRKKQIWGRCWANNTNDCVMNSEQNALIRGSDPP